MAFVGKDILIRKNLRNGADLEGLAELLLFLLPDEILRMDADDIIVGALHSQAVAQRPDSRHIGVGIVLQIHCEIAGGEEGVQAAQHVAELGVFRFQPQPVAAAPKQKGQDI